MIPRRLLLYLYGTPNIIGSALALLALALFFVGLIRDYWLFIVVGLYLVGYRVAPRHADIHLDKALAEGDARRAAEKLVKKARRALSEPAARALDRVWEVLDSLLGRLDRFDAHDRVVHDIRQTAIRHLPELLEQYLALPPAYARFHHVRSGKTPRDLFIEQLSKLEVGLKAALHDVLNDDVDKLRAQGAFLEKTFARGKDWLG